MAVVDAAEVIGRKFGWLPNATLPLRQVGIILSANAE
jgi:hypothetical protein